MASKAALELLLQLKGDQQAARGAKSVQQELHGLAGAARGVQGTLKTMFAAVGGYAVMRAGLRLVTGAAREVRGAIFDMNSVLETSGLQFETLMGSADLAREHIKMLFDFAKLTPFETQPIIEASRMLQAFGREALNTRENLTMIGDASAATSAPIEELGQWVGRLYSQLQSGRPIGRAAQRLQELAVLSPEARNQMEALAEAGASASEIWAVFTRDMERFTGAMAKQANTWLGLKSTIKDTVQLLSATAFKPLFDEARRVAKTIAEMLNAEAAEEGAARIGTAVQTLIDRAKRLVREWIGRFGDMELGTARSIGRIAGFMVELARQAVAWGQNVVGSLAVGISSAVGLVTQAINFLGRVIGGLLKPGSAPRLLPDLGEWGRGAAEAWLAGWTQADFSALGAFAGEVQGSLRALAGTGGMAERDVVPRLLGSREAFARLLQDIRQTGRASAEAFAAIRRAAGPVGEQAEELARRYARVAEATGRLAEIQKRLTGIEGAQRERLDRGRLAELEAILADPRASAGQRERARLEQEQIGLLIEQRDLQADLDAAQEDLDAYRSRLDIETETLSLLGQQRTLLQSLVQAIKDALDPLAQQLKGWQVQQAELKALIRLAEIDYSLQNDKLTAAQRVALELERQELTIGRMIRAQEAAELGIDLSGLAKVQIVLADFRKAAGGALGDGEDGLAGLIKGAQDELDELQGYDLSELLKPLDEVMAEMRLGFEEGEEAAANLRDTLAGITEPDWWAELYGGAGKRPKSTPMGDLARDVGTLNSNVGDLIGLVAGVREQTSGWDKALQTLRDVLGPMLPQISGLTYMTLPSLRAHIAGLNVLLGLGKLAVLGMVAPLFAAAGLIAGLAGVDSAVLDVLRDLGTFVSDAFVQGVVQAWTLITNPVKYLHDRIREAIDAFKTLRDLIRNDPGSAELPGQRTSGPARFAGGTGYFGGGLAWVGERGPELLALPRGSRIWPAQQSAAMAGAMGGGGLTVNMGPVYVRNEEDMDVLVWKIIREVKRRER